MLSGSVAMSIYTLPRATRDIDLIVNLQKKDVEPLIQYFKEGYYCDADAVRDAIKNHSLFNIIDYASGFKADFVILKNEPFRVTEFNRRVQNEFEGKMVYTVTPEDLLLSKIIWIQDFQSGLQMTDIKSLSSIENMDWPYINKWITSLKLNTYNLLPNNG